MRRPHLAQVFPFIHSARRLNIARRHGGFPASSHRNWPRAILPAEGQLHKSCSRRRERAYANGQQGVSPLLDKFQAKHAIILRLLISQSQYNARGSMNEALALILKLPYFLTKLRGYTNFLILLYEGLRLSCFRKLDLKAANSQPMNPGRIKSGQAC